MKINVVIDTTNGPITCGRNTDTQEGYRQPLYPACGDGKFCGQATKKAKAKAKKVSTGHVVYSRSDVTAVTVRSILSKAAIEVSSHFRIATLAIPSKNSG